jgi:hypothetical protein
VSVVGTVPVPHDCTDGFCASYWRRPEAYLDPGVRANISNLAQLEGELDEGVEQLRSDLASGAWQRRYLSLLDLDEIDLGYRIVRSP